MPVTVWIDADALPSTLKDYLLKVLRVRQVLGVFVANQPIALPSHPLFQSVQVEQGADVADAYIVEHAQAGDLAITQDIPLADLLMAQGVSVLSLQGQAFTQANMKSRLAVRDLLYDLRSAGIATKGPKPFDVKQKQAFMNGFDKALTACLKHQTDQK
jgi:uncharacterized protein YaiI (UPF0178 family)